MLNNCKKCQEWEDNIRLHLQTGFHPEEARLVIINLAHALRDCRVQDEAISSLDMDAEKKKSAIKTKEGFIGSALSKIFLVFEKKIQDYILQEIHATIGLNLTVTDSPCTHKPKLAASLGVIN